MLRKILILVGLLVLAVGVLATIDLPNQQPRLPVALDEDQGLEVTGPHPDFPSDQHSLVKGDRIRTVNGVEVPDGEFFTFVLDGLRVSDRVKLKVRRKGAIVEAEASLVPLLTNRALIINALVALGVWAFGMLILLKGTVDRNIGLFFAMAMSLTPVLLVYWPENTLGFSWGSRVSWFLSNGLYPFTVAFLLHFALVFPERIGSWTRKLVPALYLPTLAIGGWLIVGVARARGSMAYADFDTYRQAFQVFRIYLAGYFVMSPLLWGIKYIKTRKFATRQRLKWVFWGFIMGISPHILFHELPKGLGLGPFLPEELSHPGALVASLAMVVAIARYRILDVDLVINKSIVYTALTLFVVFAYLLLVGLGEYLVMQWFGQETPWVRVVVITMLVLMFAPARTLAQTVVDRLFFRSQYDQRLALMAYSRDLARTIDIRELSDKLSGLLRGVIPIESIQVFVTGDQPDQMNEVFPAQDGEQDNVTVLDGDRITSLKLAEREGAFQPESGENGPDGASLLVPLRLDQRLVGLIVMGDKRSGQPFHEDDLRFVDAVADQTAVAFETARAFKLIQDLNVCLEQKVFDRTAQLAEANDRLVEQYEKLKQLDELKEAMTRMVVHDLRNPVSTILLGLDFMDDSEVSQLPADVHSAMEIIRSTVQEMQDLIANLLDATRMESGNLQLSKQVVSIRSILEEGTRRVQVLAESRKVKLQLQVQGDPAASLDKPLMTRVLVNLLTNSIKFSPSMNDVEVAAGRHDGSDEFHMSVANSGPIIPADMHEKIFEKFAQVRDQQAAAFAGVGLGLAFCKLVVEAHGGRIELQSPVAGRESGAKFSVIIPG